MDHIAWDEIDVVVAEANAGVADSLSAQLVEFGVIHPLHALEKKKRRGLIWDHFSFPYIKCLKLFKISIS